MTEEEPLAKHSTPDLRRNVLPRQAKKLNMEFDSQYAHMTRAERDEFLDKLYPEDIKPRKEPPDATGHPDAVIRPRRDGPSDQTSGAAEKAETAPDKEEAGQEGSEARTPVETGA